jgi:cytidyltransferase-like protein
MKIAITSVYANPLHPGHVECFELSKKLADELWVIVNNDEQAKLKRGIESFQDETYRARLVESIKHVDKVILSIDTDATVCETLRSILSEIQNRPEITEVIFTKGGDRFASEIPEAKVLTEFGVKIVDGLGEKIYSSSSYVNRLANQKDAGNLASELKNVPKDHQEQEYIEVGLRPWGVYYVLEDKKDYKVKKIIVKEGQRLSLQSHKHRSEHWVVVEGVAMVQTRRVEDPEHIGHQILRPNESCYIPQGYVHRLSNEGETPLVLIEVQTGSYTGEDDIVRYQDDYTRHITEATQNDETPVNAQ